MDVSGTYLALQFVEVGDLVQLAYGREGYVMLVYERPFFSHQIIGLSNVRHISLFNDIVYAVSRPSPGTVTIQAFARQGGLLATVATNTGQNLSLVPPPTIPIWSQTITMMTTYSTNVMVGPGGVYVLIWGDGNFLLPNANTVQQANVRVLLRFGLDGVFIGYTTIQGALAADIIYDYGSNEAVIFGNANDPLVIAGDLVINRLSPYSFVISLTPSLLPDKVLQADDIIITDIAANGTNLVYTHREDGNTILNYLGVDGGDWHTSLGAFTTGDLGFFTDTIAVVGTNDNIPTETRIILSDITGQNITNRVLPTEGVTELYQFAVDSDAFLLYAISSIPGGKQLIEYNVQDDILIWAVSVPDDVNLLTGTTNAVSVGDNNTVSIFGKRWPGLIGVVSELLVQGWAGPGCPPTYQPCSPDVCCPTLPPLPNTGEPPQVIKVDFGLTSAFAPTTPGQEYFIDNNGDVTTDETPPNRYIGTALDATRVLLKMTGNVLN